jgi:deoxyadenosine/deoxycytidine kinase
MQREPAKFIIDRMNEIDLYISIQAIISAGKSSLLNSIKKNIKKNNLCALNDLEFADSFDEHNKYLVNGVQQNSNQRFEFLLKDYFLLLDEPLDEWRKEIYSIQTKNNINENTEMSSILNLFYKDMSKYGFLFQINAFTSRLKNIVDQISLIKDHNKNCRIHIIAERSLRTDRLFFNNLYENNVITQVEWDIYNNFFNLICNEIVKKEDIMIYLRVSPEKCYERTQKRDRKEEKNNQEDGENGDKKTGVSLDYLKELYEQHEIMVNNFRLEKGKKVIDIDFEKDLDEEGIDLVANNLMENIFSILKENSEESEKNGNSGVSFLESVNFF